MLVLLSRAPRADMSYWRGRRVLAACDALAWPAMVLLLIRTAPFNTGVFGLVASSLALLVAVRRLHRAVSRNHRYLFTTLRWGRALLLLLVIGAGAKLMS